MNTWLMLLLWKPSLLMAAALLAIALQRRASAATGALTAQLGLLAALLLPVGWLAMPSIALPMPPGVQAVAPFTSAEGLVASPESASIAAPISGTGTETGMPPAPAPFPWIAATACAYLAIAGAMLLRTCRAALRLHMLARGAAPMSAPTWRAALGALSGQMGIRREVRVLVSQQVASPLSWGLWRPVILIDPHSLANADPHDILGHELAHVVRCDWPALMLARLAGALYWFNPLCWLLVRQAEQQMERAADDCVIAHGAQASAYARTLLQAGARGAGPDRHASNGIAPSRSALGQRIACLLDAGRNRQPTKPAQMAAYAVAAALVSGPLSALEFVTFTTSPASGVHDQGRPAGSVADQLDRLGNANFAALATAMRRRDYSLRHARGNPASFDVPAAVAPLTEALRDPDPIVRQLAAWGFSEMRRRDSVATVAPLLQDSVAAVRGEAARALGDIGATAMAPQLAALLRDPDAGVRRQAAHALGDLQELGSMPALLAASADPDDGVQAEVRWAIKEVKEK